MCVHVRNVATDKSLEIYDMEWSITILALVLFYSRIVMRKLLQNIICKYRKVENELKNYKGYNQFEHEAKLVIYSYFLAKITRILVLAS